MDVGIGIVLGIIFMVIANSAFIAGVYTQRKWSQIVQFKRTDVERLIATVDQLTKMLDMTHNVAVTELK